MQQSFTDAVDIEIKPDPRYPATPTVLVTEILIHFSTHPATSEAVTAKYKSNEGDSFTHLLFQQDPSETDDNGDDITEVRWSFTENFPLKQGEKIQIEYPNTDGNTVDVSFIHKYM